MAFSNIKRRERIKRGIRNKVTGTAQRPRLSVFRSNKAIYAQLIDDQTGKTIVAASSRDKEIAEAKLPTKIEVATSVGLRIGQLATKAGIAEIKFDRGGYLYHGRVKALADGAREGGLKF